MLENIWYISRVDRNMISHSSAALTREISSSTIEVNLHAIISQHNKVQLLLMDFKDCREIRRKSPCSYPVA